MTKLIQDHWIDFLYLRPGEILKGAKVVIVHTAGSCLAKWNGDEFIDDKKMPWSHTVRYWMPLPEMPVWNDSDDRDQG